MTGKKKEEEAAISSAAAGEEEPASLNLHESARREGAVDKMLGEAKLSAVVPKQAGASASMSPAAAASKFKRRLTKSEIMTIVALKPEPFPSADYLDCLADYDPPGLIAEKKRQHEEDAAYFAKMNEEFEVFRQKVINGLKNDGYYEVDEDYLEAREKANEEVMRHPVRLWADMDPSERRLRVATPEERHLLIGNGYIPYVPDEEDEALINLGDDDFSASDEEDDFSASDEEDVFSASDDEAEEGDNAHKRSHLIESN